MLTLTKDIVESLRKQGCFPCRYSNIDPYDWSLRCCKPSGEYCTEVCPNRICEGFIHMKIPLWVEPGALVCGKSPSPVMRIEDVLIDGFVYRDEKGRTLFFPVDDWNDIEEVKEEEKCQNDSK